MSQPMATARDDSATAAPETTQRRSYSFWLGGGTRLASLDFGLHLHDVDSESFSVASLTATKTPRYLLATASLDIRIQAPVTKFFAIGGHLGPSGGVLLDRTGGIAAAGGNGWGEGVRVGALASARLGPVAAFADVYATQLLFVSGPAQGASWLSGVTVGVALR